MPEDIGLIATFLASDEARWLTGEIVFGSGGLRSVQRSRIGRPVLPCSEAVKGRRRRHQWNPSTEVAIDSDGAGRFWGG
jgi:hypothetical protein